jgi:RNA polymerase sigma-70 factor (ECF subfamily)
VTNTAIDHVRGRNKRAFQVVHLDNMGDIADEDPALAELEPDILLRGIQHLPLTTRTVLNMHLFEAYSHKQIASALGISESTSRWHLTEARKKLKQYFSVEIALAEPPRKKNMCS